jgi:hypothetical protein
MAPRPERARISRQGGHDVSARLSLLVFGIVLLAFTAYTAEVVASHGYTGFLVLAGSEPWAGQMLADLVIALLLFATWMRGDAAREGLPFWPYFAAVLTLGSVGALAYLVHRSASRVRGGELAASRP